MFFLYSVHIQYVAANNLSFFSVSFYGPRFDIKWHSAAVCCLCSKKAVAPVQVLPLGFMQALSNFFTSVKQ